MNKQQLLKKHQLSEKEFMLKYPTEESFFSSHPEDHNSLVEYALGGDIDASIEQNPLIKKQVIIRDSNNRFLGVRNQFVDNSGKVVKQEVLPIPSRNDGRFQNLPEGNKPVYRLGGLKQYGLGDEVDLASMFGNGSTSRDMLDSLGDNSFMSEDGMIGQPPYKQGIGSLNSMVTDNPFGNIYNQKEPMDITPNSLLNKPVNLQQPTPGLKSFQNNPALPNQSTNKFDTSKMLDSLEQFKKLSNPLQQDIVNTPYAPTYGFAEGIQNGLKQPNAVGKVLKVGFNLANTASNYSGNSFSNTELNWQKAQKAKQAYTLLPKNPNNSLQDLYGVKAEVGGLFLNQDTFYDEMEKGGFSLGETYDMSPQEIIELKKQGYKIEIQ